MKITSKEIKAHCQSSLTEYYHCQYCDVVVELRTDMIIHLSEKHQRDIIKDMLVLSEVEDE